MTSSHLHRCPLPHPTLRRRCPRRRGETRRRRPPPGARARTSAPPRSRLRPRPPHARVTNVADDGRALHEELDELLRRRHGGLLGDKRHDTVPYADASQPGAADAPWRLRGRAVAVLWRGGAAGRGASARRPGGSVPLQKLYLPWLCLLVEAAPPAVVERRRFFGLLVGRRRGGLLRAGEDQEPSVAIEVHAHRRATRRAERAAAGRHACGQGAVPTAGEYETRHSQGRGTAPPLDASASKQMTHSSSSSRSPCRAAADAEADEQALAAADTAAVAIRLLPPSTRRKWWRLE